MQHLIHLLAYLKCTLRRMFVSTATSEYANTSGKVCIAYYAEPTRSNCVTSVRIETLPLGLILLVSVGLGWPLAAAADPATHEVAPVVETDPTVAKAKIAEVLAEPEFETAIKEEVWEYQGELDWQFSQNDDPLKESDLFWMFTMSFTNTLEIVLWLALGVIIALIIYYKLLWLPTNLLNLSDTEEYTPVTSVAKWSAMQSTLPADLLGAVRELWQRGEQEAALSLLYRGALATMVARDGLEIRDSATEGECLRLVKRQQPVEVTAYFARLTRLWQGIAYAHRLPADLDIEQLCDEWGQWFSTETIAASAHTQ